MGPITWPVILDNGEPVEYVIKIADRTVSSDDQPVPLAIRPFEFAAQAAGADWLAAARNAINSMDYTVDLLRLGLSIDGVDMSKRATLRPLFIPLCPDDRLDLEIVMGNVHCYATGDFYGYSSVSPKGEGVFPVRDLYTPSLIYYGAGVSPLNHPEKECPMWLFPLDTEYDYSRVIGFDDNNWLKNAITTVRLNYPKYAVMGYGAIGKSFRKTNTYIVKRLPLVVIAPKANLYYDLWPKTSNRGEFKAVDYS